MSPEWTFAELRGLMIDGMNVIRLASPTLLLILFAVYGAGCSTGPRRLVEPALPGTETIAIVGTNDLHGALTGPAGIAVMAGYIRVLRQEWGAGMLWLDAGDAMTGTLEAGLDQGRTMIAALNSAGLDAATLGDGDLVLEALPQRMAEAHFSILAANLAERATKAHPALPGLLPSKMYSVGRLRVGVIGLVSSSGTASERKIYASKYLATRAVDATTREAKHLRDQGAEVVVLLAHLGVHCEPGAAPSGHALRKPLDPLGRCSRQDELSKLLLSLPAGTLDAVVSGESHQLVHHFLPAAQGTQVPVIQGGGFGVALNVIYLSYDWTHHQLLPERARIEGPIPVRDGGDFHGRGLDRDPQVTEIVQAADRLADPVRSEVLAQSEKPLENGRTESALGDLAADAARTGVSADISLITPGILRTGLPQGKIRFADLWRSIPYESRVVSVDLTGEELLLLLRIATNGSRGFPSVSGLNLRVLSPGADATARDLNGNHRTDPWEIDRLIEARLSDGSEIRPKTTYHLATIDYLARGGDDFEWFFSRIPDARFSRVAGPRLRDLIRTTLAERARSGPVNSLAGARYQFETKRPKKAKGAKRHGRPKKRRK